MKIKSILSALLLMVSSVASAQYLNVKLEDGTCHSYKTTPNMKVSFGDKAGAEVTESTQTVTVNGHTVTVSVDEAGGTPYDILVRAYTDGDVAKVEAFAKSGKALFCSIAGTATCAHTKTDNIYTFTISNITSNVAAKIGYQNAESISLDRTTVKPAKGWVIHLTATVGPSDAINKKVAWSSNHSDIASVDENGNVTAVAQGEATITATATDGTGISATCTVEVGPAIPSALSHEFSVSATKKVHFSKGNLWAEAGSNTLHFEANQWQFDSDLMLSSHKSYFEWSNASNDSYLFCDENHKQAVDGSDDIYYVLSLDEWRYLLNIDRNEYIRKDKCKLGVTVCGLTRCLVIAPDDWDISTMPLQASYDEASWKSAEDAGLVCLPAAGNRSEEVVFVDGVGSFGSYWSSSTESHKSYDIRFDENFHYYPNSKSTDRCLRLVTN